ncbi:MAG TPA: hypothetical protein VKK79_16615, partial [Candidatus Lokiarchaeia archaeon]|nr:hypothetical protein [Candidatus Lokiarchaeia archaeon]
MSLASVIGRGVISFSLSGIAGVYAVLQELWLTNVNFGGCPVQMASYAIAVTVPIAELAISLLATVIIPRRFSLVSHHLKQWVANIGSALIGV